MRMSQRNPEGRAVTAPWRRWLPPLAATAVILTLLALPRGGPHAVTLSYSRFVTDVGAYRSALPAIGQAWRAHFGRYFPAMGLFGISELFEPGAQVELMGIAVLAE